MSNDSTNTSEKSFKDSQEAANRAFIRRLVRNKGGFTRAECAVVLALFNHHSHHKRKEDGVIRPGRTKIAKAAKCSVITVARCFAVLRRQDVLIVVKYLHGGGRAGKLATEYRFSETALVYMCGGLDWVEIYHKFQTRDRNNIGGSNDTPKNTIKACQNDTPSIGDTLHGVSPSRPTQTEGSDKPFPDDYNFGGFVQ